MKDPLTILEQIDRLASKIDACTTQLENAAHLPRKVPLPKGVIPTILNECDPTCPSCALGRKYANRRSRLGQIQRDALMRNAQDSLRARTNRRAKSRRPRRRKPNLWLRGFRRVLKEFPDITLAELRGLLPRSYDSYDDEDVELRLNGFDIVVRDLDSGEIATIKKSSQPVYLRRARKHLDA